MDFVMALWLCEKANRALLGLGQAFIRTMIGGGVLWGASFYCNVAIEV